VKMRAVPVQRCAYYWTLKRFAEKSRLSVDYFSSSFSFFHQARADCSATLTCAGARGSRTAPLLGISDLGEIAVICATEAEMTIRAEFDSRSPEIRFVGIPVALRSTPCWDRSMQWS